MLLHLRIRSYNDSYFVGHEDRIMSVVASPCGEYVLSSAADETLRLWHCFAHDAKSKGATFWLDVAIEK